jgi:hypothetical protein
MNPTFSSERRMPPVGGIARCDATSGDWVWLGASTGSRQTPKHTAQSEDAISEQTYVITTTSPEVIAFDDLREARSEKDALLAEIRGLSSLSDGWDGEGSRAPTPNIINDAIAVAQAWPVQLPLPTLDLDVDGHIVLDLISDNGLVAAGFDFIGRDRLAVFSIVGGASGKIKTTSPTAIIKVFSSLRDALVTGAD